MKDARLDRTVFSIERREVGRRPHGIGFDLPDLKPEIFLDKERIVRLGEPPVQIEIFSSILGVESDACFANRIIGRWDDISVSLIGRSDLMIAKKAFARHLDLSDIEKLGNSD